MASSSQKTHKLQNPIEEVTDLGKEERGRDCLELALGLGFSSGYKIHEHEKSYPLSVSGLSTLLAPPTSPLVIHQHDDHHHQQQQQQQQIELGLGLGLGLGFDYKGVRYMNMAPPSNNHNMLWQDHQVQDHNYEPDLPFLNAKIHMFNDANDCSTSRRPHPGFWFTLISSTNGVGEALPQIPKAYIRVKDENMTVFTIKKYLVTKLGLSNEAEIDMSCMGQNLLQTLTLKQVRDAVWLPKLIHSVNSTTLLFRNSEDLTMPLHYGRRCV